MNISALIEELNQTDEHERIEAKTGSEPGKAVMKTAVAFANEPRLDGGHILFGVQRQEEALRPAYEVVGVPDPDKVSADFSSQCASMLNRKIRPRVKTAMVEGKPIVAAYVPEAHPAEKPVYIKSKGRDQGTYRRIGSTDQQCTEDDLREFYEEQSGRSFDAGVVHDADLEDLDPAAIEDYRKTRERVNPDAEELNLNDEDLLRSLRCTCEERGAMRPTTAGILLFGLQMSLRRLLPAMRVDYMRVPGTEWMEDPDRRYVNSIEIRAPLMQAIRRAQSAVLDDLPKGFALPEGSLQRTDEPIIPLRPLREAIVNAVMHRDYRKHSAVQIIRYANRIEIHNPGYSLIAPDELGKPGSETRNPVIANVLHDTRFAETKGTGIGVMRRGMQKAGLAPPAFDSDRAADHFVATFYLHHFLDTDDLKWLGHFKHLALSEAEVRALVHARQAGRIDNATYRELNSVETLKASQDLRRLREAELLTMEGKGTATYYEPTEKLLNPPAGPSVPSLFDETSEAEEQIPPATEENTPAGEQIPPAEEQITPATEENTPASLRGRLPVELRNRLRSLGGKAPRDEVRAAILALCRWQPLSASEIARLTDRGKKYVTRQYLNPMVEAGALERTVPEAPSSPNQKYRAADSDE